MGTFHHGKGELHGITVVVDTTGSIVLVGRCDRITPEGVVLLDADHHDAEGSDLTKDAWVERATQYGVWARIPRVIVPTDEVASVRRLGEID